MLKSSSLLTMNRSNSTTSPPTPSPQSSNTPTDTQKQSTNTPTDTQKHISSQKCKEKSGVEIETKSSSLDNNNTHKINTNCNNNVSLKENERNTKDHVSNNSILSKTSEVSISNSKVKDSSPVNSVTSAPCFVSSMKDCQVCSGDAVRFDVSVTGNPLPSVSWYFDNEELKLDDSRIDIEECSDSGLFSLIIRNIEDDDEGEYKCKAENSSGQVACSAELSVLEL